jgi:hypothetical protein
MFHDKTNQNDTHSLNFQHAWDRKIACAETHDLKIFHGSWLIEKISSSLVLEISIMQELSVKQAAN